MCVLYVACCGFCRCVVRAALPRAGFVAARAVRRSGSRAFSHGIVWIFRVAFYVVGCAVSVGGSRVCVLWRACVLGVCMCELLLGTGERGPAAMPEESGDESRERHRRLSGEIGHSDQCHREPRRQGRGVHFDFSADSVHVPQSLGLASRARDRETRPSRLSRRLSRL